MSTSLKPTFEHYDFFSIIYYSFLRSCFLYPVIKMAARTLCITSKFCKQLLKRTTGIRTMSSEPEIIIEETETAGFLTLNRPKALNALNLSMVEKILPTLKKWEHEKQFVIVKGAGGKAFCAGGDVRAVVEAGRKGDPLGHNFFRQEYTMNGVIGTYRIPYIALIDGIVMGGGVGLSVHGQYRIATENTLFAMPETAIGLFPDVGGSYFLPRLRGKLGCYLALTGYRLKGADVYKAGIATHYCESSKLADLENDLREAKNFDSANNVLLRYVAVDDFSFSLDPYMNQINECFSANTMEAVLVRLEKDGSKWALDTLKTLKNMSPTSMKVTLKVLQLGSKMTLHECLQMEYRLAVSCLANHDFYEGVRALLIDKDKKPKWNPPSLQEVPTSLVERHFKKLPENEELKHKL